MKKIYFRFYAHLNKFFSSPKDGQLQVHHFKGRQSIKDRIETMGVPHTEVSLILCNGQPVNFSQIVEDGDRFSIYPRPFLLPLPEKIRLRPPYPGKPRFVLDTHLGKLARYLRRYNFDTVYRNDFDDREIVDLAQKEKRIILTRDHGLLMRKRVVYGFFIHDDDPQQQLASVFAHFDLFQYDTEEKGRCTSCNTELKEVPKEEIIERLEPKTKKFFQEFRLCPDCDQIYWKGSHYKKTEKLLADLPEKILENRSR
ncbi:MAG: Mut7-C RNAse domain-containing protein [Bacillota bacterium]